MIRKIILLCIVLLFSCSTESQEIKLQLDKELWLEDIKYLKQKVEDIVPMYNSSKEKFNTIYNDLMTSNINGYDAVFGIQNLLNTLDDEGCNMPLFQKGLELEILPIKTYWFTDGLYVLDASSNYSEIVNKLIVKINDIPVKEVFNKLKDYINADNEYYKKYLFQIYGFMPKLLKSIDIGKSDNEIKLELSTNEKIILRSSSINEYAKLNRKLPNDEFFNFTNKNHKGENYWFEFLPNSKTLFVQLQVIKNNEEGDSFSDFISKIERNIRSNKTDKIIIDVRYGGGGNGFKLKKLTDLLRESKSINKEGCLFVLTSKATRGTLLEFASILSLNTKVILVGEPTAEGVNTVGDNKYISLPNSGMKVSLTQTLWPTSWSLDKSTFLIPDEKVNFTYSDKIENKDSWLNVVKNYKVSTQQKTIPSELQSKLIGTYRISGRKVSVVNKDGNLFLIMKRKIKSFFEIHTELYFQSEGVLSSDIKDVFLYYKTDASKKATLKGIKWKGINLTLE